MGWRQKVQALFNRQELSDDLDEELQFHLEMRKQLNIQNGMSADEAASRARRQIGNQTWLKEEMREIDLFTFPETVWQDLKFALRMLSKHRRFTFTAILALGLGLGVNTAVFTVYRAFLLRPLDASNPKQLVNIGRTNYQGKYDPNFSYSDFEFFRDRNLAFSGLIAATADEVTLSGVGDASSSGHEMVGALANVVGLRMPNVMSGGAEFVTATVVSDNYFSVLGVGPMRGRTFDAADTRDANPVAMISENYWHRKFNADPDLIGRSIKLNGVSFTVIGITPHDFMGTNLNVPNFWVPLHLWNTLHPGDDILHDRENACCRLYARLAPASSLSEAQTEMNVLADQLRPLHAAHSDSSKPLTILLYPGSPFGRTLDIDLKLAIALIMCAVGMVLVIACANLASLQLARSSARQSEIGLRLSLGASRGRLIRQLLTESAALGLLAGIVSIVLTFWILRLIVVAISQTLYAGWGAFALHVTPDIQIFGYVFVISLLAGVLFGLVPALESSKPNLISVLKEEGSHRLFGGKNRLRDALIAIQVAVCLVLLIAGGLLIKSSIRSVEMKTGYETAHILSLDLYFPDGFGYTREKEVSEVHALQARIRSLPGVEDVSIGRPPAGGGLRSAVVALDGEKPAAENPQRMLYYTYVQPNYFSTLNVPLTLGQGFSSSHTSGDAVVVLSESAAKELWPGQDPVGKKLLLDGADQFHSKDELLPTRASYQVIGVVGDTRGVLMDGTDVRKAYFLLPNDRLDDRPLLVRTQTDPKLQKSDIEERIRTVDPNMIVYSATLDDMLRTSPQFVVSRCSAIFASIAGSLGLLLASIGIYGTVSYAVVRRTREVGIRMALGATKRDVIGLILVECTRPVILGLLLGIIGAVGVAQLMRAILFGVSTLDAASYIGVSAFFFAIAMLAAYLPARKATLVDPMVALRYE